MAGQSKSNRTSRKTERFLRRFTMLMRLLHIKSRMASASTGSSASASSIARPPRRHRFPSSTAPPPIIRALPESFNEMVLRRYGGSVAGTGRSAFLVLDRQRPRPTSKRSLRLGHRRRLPQPSQEQLEREATAEQQPPRGRVIAVVILPPPPIRQVVPLPATVPMGPLILGRSSSRSRRRRLTREALRMNAGRPHVLNMVRRVLGSIPQPVPSRPNVLESMATMARNGNGEGMFISQAQNERTPEKGSKQREDNQKTG